MFRKFNPTAITCLIFLIAATQATAAFNDYSMIFDGTNEYVWKSISDWRSGDSEGTISVWIKTIEASAQVLFGSADSATTSYEFLFLIHSTGAVYVWQKNNDTADYVYASTDVTDGSWHHCVLVSDGNEYFIYVDGNPETLTVGGEANTGDWFSDTINRDNLSIGAEVYSTDRLFFNGNIDEVSVWNKALSSNEVSEIYNSGTPLNLLNHSAETNLVSWWRMGDGGSWDETNWTIPDLKGTNNGTSANMEDVDRSTDAPGEYPPIPSGTTFMAR